MTRKDTRLKKLIRFNDVDYHIGFSRYPVSKQIAIVLTAANDDAPSIEATASFTDVSIDLNNEAVISGTPPGLMNVLRDHGVIGNTVTMLMVASTPGNTTQPDDIVTVAKLLINPLDRYFECAYCNKSDNKMKTCGQCKLLYYCCREHQIKDWNEFHRYECAKYVNDMNTPLGSVDIDMEPLSESDSD